MFKRTINLSVLFALLTSSLFLFGCGPGGTGMEWGHTPTGNFSYDPWHLNSYGSRMTAGNGIVVTKRNGHIDPDHMNKEIRITKAIYDQAIVAIQNNQTSLTNDYLDFTINYPSDWQSKNASEKQKIAKEVALLIAQNGSFYDGIWYEAITWYGYNCTYIMSDFQSAFSWEDLYSDYAGCLVALQAIKQGGDFNSTVTRLKQKFVTDSIPVSRDEAERITKSVKGSWSRQDFGIARTYTIIKRNMDIGVGDGTVDPSLIPGFATGTPDRLPIPKMSDLEKYGFKLRIQIDRPWQASTIKSKLGINRPVEPKDFPKMIQIIANDAKNRHSFSVDM